MQGERANTTLASVDAIDALLPQTQCTRCGYPGCRPYAEAVAAGEADINRCPPGGDAVVGELARLLRVPARALDPGCGEQRPRMVARIDEQWCIGCTVCIRACPVDAITGARRLMHTVIADECSGCELCLEPCPVDCIHLVPATAAGDSRPAVAQGAPSAATGWFQPWSPAQAERARRRHEARQQRDARRSEQRAKRRAERATQAPDAAARRAEVLDAVRRVQARRTAQSVPGSKVDET